ncbi:MAG: YkgJ family cysteine cluster protein [archaeon]
MSSKINCSQCASCCNHIAIQIDTPETREDFSDITWYLLHENVKVFIDDEDDWYVEFSTPCSALGRDNTCQSYETRPSICRKYDPEECVTNGEGKAEKLIFRTREDLLSYLKLKDTGFFGSQMYHTFRRNFCP